MSLLSKSDVRDSIYVKGWPNVLRFVSSLDIEDEGLALLWEEAEEIALDMSLYQGLIAEYICDDDDGDEWYTIRR